MPMARPAFGTLTNVEGYFNAPHLLRFLLSQTWATKFFTHCDLNPTPRILREFIYFLIKNLINYKELLI